MIVIAVGGKAFYHKDSLKALGFKWWRESKLWVSTASSVPPAVAAMSGVTVTTIDANVDHLFSKRAAPAAPAPTFFDAAPAPTFFDAPAATPALSSLEKAKAALSRDVDPAPASEQTDDENTFAEIADLLRKIADKIEKL